MVAGAIFGEATRCLNTILLLPEGRLAASGRLSLDESGVLWSLARLLLSLRDDPKSRLPELMPDCRLALDCRLQKGGRESR